MCNARNHPPGCNCGWGEGWHQGGYGAAKLSGLFSRFSKVVRQGDSGSDLGYIKQNTSSPNFSTPIQESKNTLQGGWVTPNAKCPVCGSAVYFYKSPDGGRVYFDELGPPWPKHPCIYPSGKNINSIASMSGIPRWDQNAWEPLIDFSISLIGGGNLYQINGKSDKSWQTFQFRLEGRFEVEIVRFKEQPGVKVDLSLLARNSTSGEWLICNGTAKSGRNYPPTTHLVVVERIPYAIAEPSNIATQTEPKQNDVVSEKSSPQDLLQNLRHSIEVVVIESAFVRIEEIDRKIQSMLSEISLLNEEKTQLICSLLEPKDKD